MAITVEINLASVQGGALFVGVFCQSEKVQIIKLEGLLLAYSGALIEFVDEFLHRCLPV